MADNYISYNQTQTDLRDYLQILKGFCGKLNLESTKTSIEETLERNKNDSFNVAIVGEFKRGKSTIINALLGKSIIPADVLPCSATFNKVVYGTEPYVTIEYKDGRKEDISIDKLPEYVTKLDAESEAKSATVKEATVHYPTEYCRNNVNIIDTPGLNDSADMTEVTLNAIPQSDVSVFVIMANSPFSQSEADFLENKMLVSNVGKIVFAVTGIDRLRGDSKERIVDYVRERIHEYIIARAEKVYGKDSDEYKNCLNKLGEIRVVGLSGYQALKAKTNNDTELLKESNFLAFEQEISKIITEDRGAIILNMLANKVITSSGEILKAIQLKDNALMLHEDEFKSKYDEAKKSMEEIREKRDLALSSIEKSAAEACDKIQPHIDTYFETIEKAAVDAIEFYPLSSEVLTEDNLELINNTITEKIKTATENDGQNVIEKINTEIEKAVGKEAKRLEGFEAEFLTSIDGVQSTFSAKTDSIGDNKTANTIDMGMSLFESGILNSSADEENANLSKKNSFIGVAGLYALGATVARWVTVPLLFVSGFGGYKIRTKILSFFEKSSPKFSAGAVDEYKKHFCDSVKKLIAEKKKDKEMNERVNEQIMATFDALGEKIRRETDEIMKNTQDTLDDLKTQIVEKRIISKHEKEALSEMLKETNEIAIKASKINKRS